MKFIYEYRTSDNVPHQGTIAASTKEAAYDTLKAQGIKPGKVWEAPGILNKVFGKGKRWIAILVLLAIAISSTYAVLRLTNEVKELKQDVDDKSLYEDRGQLYGDPVLMRELTQDNWKSTFENVGDRYLSSYAIPCQLDTTEWNVEEVATALEGDLRRRNVIADDELREVAQMKRMVNGMRRELQEYVEAGGSVRGYMKQLPIRQKAEMAVFERAKRDATKISTNDEWRERNNMLRAKGLPMVPSEGE